MVLTSPNIWKSLDVRVVDFVHHAHVVSRSIDLHVALYACALYQFVVLIMFPRFAETVWLTTSWISSTCAQKRTRKGLESLRLPSAPPRGCRAPRLYDELDVLNINSGQVEDFSVGAAGSSEMQLLCTPCHPWTHSWTIRCG